MEGTTTPVESLPAGPHNSKRVGPAQDWFALTAGPDGVGPDCGGHDGESGGGEKEGDEELAHGGFLRLNHPRKG